MMTTLAFGEEDSYAASESEPTTLAAGEEEEPTPTTLSVGEEEGDPTTLRVGEEDEPKSFGGAGLDPFGAF